MIQRQHRQHRHQNKGQFGGFSTDHLNTDGERRTVMLDPQRQGKSWQSALRNSLDLRYNDATQPSASRSRGEDEAIDSNIPGLPDDGNGRPTRKTMSKPTVLMFEDLWPLCRRRYDMNDVMIKYSSKVCKHILNIRYTGSETVYALP